MRTAGGMEGADLRTIGGVRGGMSMMLDLAALTMKMSPCDGTGVPLLRWVRLMITYHTTYTFICIQRIGPPPASAAQNSLVFIHLFPRIDHQILRGNKQTKSSYSDVTTKGCIVCSQFLYAVFERPSKVSVTPKEIAVTMDP